MRLQEDAAKRRAPEACRWHLRVQDMNLRLIMLSGVLILCGGCSTLETRDGARSEKYYPATKMDFNRIGEGMSSSGDPGAMIGGLALISVPLYIMDVPISLISDTICLPFDIFYKEKNKAEECQHAPPAGRREARRP